MLVVWRQWEGMVQGLIPARCNLQYSTVRSGGRIPVQYCKNKAWQLAALKKGGWGGRAFLEVQPTSFRFIIDSNQESLNILKTIRVYAFSIWAFFYPRLVLETLHQNPHYGFKSILPVDLLDSFQSFWAPCRTCCTRSPPCRPQWASSRSCTATRTGGRSDFPAAKSRDNFRRNISMCCSSFQIQSNGKIGKENCL